MTVALLLALWAQQPATTTIAKADPVVGLWKAVPPAGTPERWWYWTFDIRKDGTFRQHRDLRSMMNILGDSKGTWRRETGGVRLSGSAKESVDDGYVKSMLTSPIDDLLIEKDGRLIIRQSIPGVKVDPSMDLVFRRVTTLNREPEPPPPAPDPQGTKIWARCRKTYRGFASYRASGRGVHPGEKNRPLLARFDLSYTRASGLTLRGTDSGSAFHVQVTSTSSRTRFSYFPEAIVGGRWDAFDRIAERSGLDFGLMAELLLTPGPKGSSRYGNFRLLRESTVDGVPCFDLSFGDDQGHSSVASIAKKSHLLLRIQDSTGAFRISIKGSGVQTKPVKR